MLMIIDPLRWNPIRWNRNPPTSEPTSPSTMSITTPSPRLLTILLARKPATRPHTSQAITPMVMLPSLTTGSLVTACARKWERTFIGGSEVRRGTDDDDETAGTLQLLDRTLSMAG